jgi:hypothetical protein
MKNFFSPLFAKKKLLFAVIACSYECAGCGQISVDNTQSYHDYDASVIPLVDSYKLLKLDGKKAEWSLNLQNQPTSVQNIDTVGVVGHTILLHSFKTYARDTLRIPSWFVLDLTTHVEKQFESRKLYLQYLAAHKITASVFSVNDFSSRIKVDKQTD